MSDLQALAESEHEDVEYVPVILPVDARLAVRGPVGVFQTLFNRAASVIPAKEIIAGTGFALIEAVAGSADAVPHLKIHATDGALSVSMVADGLDVLMPGKALVPGKKIADILKLAPTATVQIEVLGITASIRSGRAQWEVQTPVGDSLPPTANVSAITLHPIPAQPFLGALSAARRAAATSTARASLMQVAVSGGALTGLDGGRLHRHTAPGLPEDLDVTLPIRAVDEVTRLIQDAEPETIEMGGNGSHVVFVVGQDTLVAQRELVAFPDVENQILGPAMSNTFSLTLDRVRLIDAVRRVRINADPDYQAIFLTLVPGKATVEGPSWSVTVSARDRAGNAARESVEAQWKGPSSHRALCLNHRHLTDLLTTLSGEHVTFKVGEDTKTARMPLFVEQPDSGFTGFVSQIRPGYLT